MRLLSSLLNRFVQNGTLDLVTADGATHRFGGRAPGPEVEVRLADRALERSLALNPELVAGEAYMDGTLGIGRGGTIHDLLPLFSVNREGLGAHASQKWLRRAWKAFRRRQQANAVAASARNARHHYDIGTDPYRLFLDDGLNSSCAHFLDPQNDTLERAQAEKIRRILRKLAIRPGMTVAEIGSGWGSLAIALARAGARVTAINLARDQLAVSRERAEAAGVASSIEFREQDYRDLSG
ncbi:MAG: class I SAM-dependent methyltransferase, partial [Acetobacteraceae bacterium]